MNHETYMRRALQIARNGFPFAMPNPMVGAVIVDPEGKIIGEGYHRKCGEAHAEVNAIASVPHPESLRSSTMYVTLEPCAHQGRTGPCARLIIEKQIPKVVVGTRDPFDKVDGKGIEMMREAGIDVTVGVLEKECQELNAMFFTAHTLHRPFVLLKWAQTADGFIGAADKKGHPAPLLISTPLISALTHRIRSAFDGILVGSGTVISDNPSLTNRIWPGKSPLPIVIDRRHRIGSKYKISGREHIVIDSDRNLDEILADLYEDHITSVIVEGGAQTLNAFISARLWDIARVEISPKEIGAEGLTRAPELDPDFLIKSREIGGHQLKYFTKNPLIDVKNL